jgi:ABC-type multidrug transport system, ATPase and permease components
MNMQKYLGGNKKNLGLYILFSILTYALVSCVFYTYSWITQTAVDADISMARIVAIICVLLVIALFAFMTILAFFKRKILENACKSLRDDIMRKIFRITIPTFFSEKTSHYSSLLLNDVETIETQFFSNVLELYGDTIQLLIMFGFIAALGWQFLLIVLLFSLPSVLQPFALKGRLGAAGQVVSEHLGIYTEKVREYITNFETIKMFGKAEVFSTKFSKDVNELEKKRKKEFMLKALNFTMVMLSVYFLKVGTQIYFVNSALNGMITVASVTLLFGFANNVGNPMSFILGYLEAINASRAIRSKFAGFMELEEDLSESSEIISFEDGVSFENVKFAYEDMVVPVLDDLTMTFTRGHKHLILGKSGSGKSTIFKLLMGYYPNYDGAIRFGKTDLREISQKSLWETMAVIHQNIFVFSGTIRDNITLFDEQYTDDQVMEVIQKSHIADLIASLPRGIYTEIAEGGTNFSGGEKQRLSIARALLANKEILLVDEGMSALDNLTAYEVENTLLASDKTIIAISHQIRPNARGYDSITVLEKGRLAVCGTYDELMKSNDYFRTYVNEMDCT